MPTEATVSRRVETRLRPMFQATPSLLAHLGGDLDRLNVGKETVLDNMILYLGWATSAVALADAPVCIVILDEVDKYPQRVGKEGDPVSLAEKRQRTFLFAKTLEISTPTDQFGRIAIGFKAGDMREWWARCVHCGEFHVLKMGNVRMDKDEAGRFLDREVYAAGGHARYVCPKCGVEWSESDRWEAVRAGKWAPAGCWVNPDGSIGGKIPETNHRSYHISALMLYPGFVTIDELAAEWAYAVKEEKAGNPGPMIDFFNSQLGEIWTEAEATTDADKLRDHIETWVASAEQTPPRYEPTAVGLPEGVLLITAGLDVQLDHIWATVYGWGFGFESWLLAEERIEVEIIGEGHTAQMDMGPVEIFLQQDWPRANKPEERLGISLAFIDSQYRTDQIYGFCAGCQVCDVWPARGDDQLKDTYLLPSKLERSTSARKRRIIQAGHLQVWRINTLMCKSRLARLMNVPHPGPGYLHLPAGTSGEYFAQMTSEHLKSDTSRNRFGRILTTRMWVPKPDAKANHLWDCSYFALAAAIRRGVQRFADPEKAKDEKPSRRGPKISRMQRFER